MSIDSGFCVSDGILAMHSVSVHGQGLVKKRGMYWPKDVPGDYFDECFKQKELGEHDCYVQEIDGVPFLVHCHKEDKYVCKVMSTHGLMVEANKVTCQRVGNE